MKFKQKAQTATEYLIILAVVIIIALIVVGVLGGIPTLGGSTSTNVASAYWQTADIGVDGFKMSVSGNDTIIFRNNFPDAIRIDALKIGDQIINSISSINRSISGGKTLRYTTSDFELGPWHFYQCSTNDVSAGNNTYYVGDIDFVGTFSNASTSSNIPGESFSETLTVIYTNLKTEATYTFVSDQKLEGECAA